MVRKKPLSKRTCQSLVSRKIKFLRGEGVPQNVAVARAIDEVRKRNPSCRRFFPDR